MGRGNIKAVVVADVQGDGFGNQIFFYQIKTEKIRHFLYHQLPLFKSVRTGQYLTAGQAV